MYHLDFVNVQNFYLHTQARRIVDRSAENVEPEEYVTPSSQHDFAQQAAMCTWSTLNGGSR